MGSKLYTILLLIFFLEIGFLLFQKPGDVPIGTDPVTIAENSNSSALTKWVMDATTWNSSAFLLSLFGSFSVIALLGVTVGSFVLKQDWIWRMGMAVGLFITFGSIIAQVWILVYDTIPGDAAVWIATICTGIFLILWAITMIDFVSGKD